MNQLMFFTNELGNLRGGMIDNEPWFVGKDVVECLGYNLSTNRYGEYIKKYCNKEDVINYNKETELQYTIELDYKELGQRGGLLISEFALYDLIVASETPSAKEFKRWITHEVLPSIRKTGGYLGNTQEMSDEEIMARALLVANKTIENKNKQIQEMETKIELIEPKADNYDLYLNTEGLTDVETFSKDLAIPKLGRNNMYNYLRECKILMKNNYPYQQFINQKFFVLKPNGYHKNAKGEIVPDYKTYITKKGLDYIIKRLKGDGYIND